MSDDDFIIGFGSDDGEPPTKFSTQSFDRSGAVFHREDIRRASDPPSSPDTDDAAFAARMKRRRGEAPIVALSARIAQAHAQEAGRLLHERLDQMFLDTGAAKITAEMMEEAIKSISGAPLPSNDDMIDAMSIAFMARNRDETDASLRRRMKNQIFGVGQLYGVPQLYVPPGADDEQ